jgi:ribosome-binding protein aMBF1 (putative translation factor)
MMVLMENVTHGPVYSRGALELAARMAARGWSRARAAKELDCDVSVLRRWLKGQRTPTLDNASRIEAIFSIEPRAWSERTEARAA